MMKKELLMALASVDTPEQHTLTYIAKLLAHSIFLGFILSCLTYLTLLALINDNESDPQDKGRSHRIKLILGSSNILFLCVGLTGIMILVSNNFTRALAIGATLALVRFRVKLGEKNLGSNLLFGIIVGVGCGVHELKVAWAVTGLYTLLQLGLYTIIKYA